MYTNFFYNMEMPPKPIWKSIREAFERQKRAGGMNQVELSKASKIKKGSLSHYLNGRRPMKEEHINSICKALGIDLQQLEISFDLPSYPPQIEHIKLTLNALRDAPAPLLTMAETLIEGIQRAAREMTPGGVTVSHKTISGGLEASKGSAPAGAVEEKAILEIGTQEEEDQEPSAVSSNILPFDQNIDAPRPVVTVKVPHYNSIAAGPPEYDTAGEGSQWSDVVMSKAKKSYYTLRVSGESMEPTLCDGDIILLDSAAEPKEDSVVAVWINGDGGTLKRWHPLKGKNEGLIDLKPDNPKYRTRRVKLEDVCIQGVVLRLIRREML